MLKAFIVDDEVHASDLLRLMLSRHFPLVEVAGAAHTVKDAYDFLTNEPVDIVFLDLELRGESGFTLLDKLPERNFHFIAFSAEADHAVQSFQYGASGYLLKPVNREELANAIALLFKRKPLIQ